MRILLSAILSFAVIALYGQKMVPEATELYLDVPVVTPGEGNAPPSDAIVLFDGTDVSKFQMPKFNYGGSMKDYKEMIPQLTAEYEGKPIVWEVKNGEMIVRPSGGPISTKQAFGDVQLHIEWLAPKVDGKSGQGYSNSGVFLMGLYEVQVLNSYENPTYSNGQAASIYKQFAPLVNASRPPDSWQEYDIIFTAPKFSDKGTLIAPARLTVFHNGVLVQNNVALLGPTCYIGATYYIAHPEKLPILIQDHGDPMRFRNIWVREL